MSRSCSRRSRGETVSHIVVTHTHRDHSPAVPAIKAATGAIVAGCGPHRAAPRTRAGESARCRRRPRLCARLLMATATPICGPGWTLPAVDTPGHTANHVAFTLPRRRRCSRATMSWPGRRAIVAPPDGSMAAYMASIDKLRGMEHRLYWPGHGGPVTEPQRFPARASPSIAACARPRSSTGWRGRRDASPRWCQRSIRACRPALHGAAALSVLAQLEDLVLRGSVVLRPTMPCRAAGEPFPVGSSEAPLSASRPADRPLRRKPRSARRWRRDHGCRGARPSEYRCGCHRRGAACGW
jgi:glyoxylase-like metal-dependent hydrolase (beta-lactamase superfamily II)